MWMTDTVYLNTHRHFKHFVHINVEQNFLEIIFSRFDFQIGFPFSYTDKNKL